MYTISSAFAMYSLKLVCEFLLPYSVKLCCGALIQYNFHNLFMIRISISVKLLDFQECPKCNVTIEKDGGCNHMVCKNQNCKADFCWVCLGPWEPHGSSW